MTSGSRSRHLIAPELVDALDFFPPLDFSRGIAPFREQGFDPAQMPPLPDHLQAIQREERFVPGPLDAPDVRVLIYTPPGKASAARPALLHIHGGGYIMGTPEINDGMNRAIAQETDCVVVSVDYRLAPETVWPGSLHDNFAALCWLAAQADELGVDPARIAIAGESAGGGHAAALALHARDQGGPAICLQLLDCPMLDDRSGTSREVSPYAGEFVWTREGNAFGWTSLLGVEAGSDAVSDDMAPARASDLSGLPPTFISLGSLDLFLDENLEFVRRLAAVGVPVELHVIPGAYHGYSLAQGSPQYAMNTELRIKALARAFGHAG